MSGENTPKRPPTAPPVVTEWGADGFHYMRSEAAPYDFRGTEWEQYGQSGGSIYFAVANGIGAVSWRVLLGNYVNDAPGEISADAIDFHYPPSMDKGFEGERDCDLVPGGKCRGDFGYLLGEPGGDEFKRGGEDAVYAWLRGHCIEEFPHA